MKVFGIIAFALFFLASSCSFFGPKEMDSMFYLSQKLNPTENGDAAPVVLRIYQLKQSQKFESGDFFSLYDKAELSLGDDLIGVREALLFPNKKVPIKTIIDPNTNYIAYMVAFRKPDRNTWRHLVPLKDGRAHEQHLILDQFKMIPESKKNAGLAWDKWQERSHEPSK